MLNSVPGIDPARRNKLIEVLDVNPAWRMHTVSDGQRRRVQICLGLLKPFDVLLLDEITVDLDVLGRADLMTFLKQECEQRGATIIYVSMQLLGIVFCCSHGNCLLRHSSVDIPFQCRHTIPLLTYHSRVARRYLQAVFSKAALSKAALS